VKTKNLVISGNNFSENISRSCSGREDEDRYESFKQVRITNLKTQNSKNYNGLAT
jgi:hypothetical protein